MKGVLRALALAVLATAASAQESAPPSATASAPASGSPTPTTLATSRLPEASQAPSTGLPAVAPIRVRLNPANVRNLADADYITWTVPGSAKANITVGNVTEGDVTFSLAAGAGSELSGNYYKYQYTRFLSSLGERVVNQGISTSNKDGSSLTLSIRGLAPGNHTLLTWHNAWDALTEVATLDIAVDGQVAQTGFKQSVRVDNIWQAAASYVAFEVADAAQEVKVVYTPSGADKRAFINGFEVDAPALGNQISFPAPKHRDERIEATDDNTATASWTAPASAEGVTYNVFLGTSPTDLKSVATGVTETSATLPGLNTVDSFYWRVDVVSGSTTYTGRVFFFRVAQLAFPGAEGWGRYARGGRGGKVIKVTSLEDTADEGTLRYALTVAKGPRIIVFDVGGVITTTARISVNDQYITLAGQTAPGKGIVIQGNPLGLTGASDVIFRHVRVRPGKVSGQTIDGMGMQGSNHCIFDRCSMGWTIDEAFSSRSAWNITFQRNMISEPLNVAGHKNYPAGTAHGYSATIGGDVGSFHHNLLAHAEGRSWSLGGGVDDSGAFAGQLDIRNNVVYNFGNRVTDGGAKKVNFVGNYYKQGPASTLTYGLRATYEDNMPGMQQYHCAGNSMPGVFDQDSVQYPAGDGTASKSAKIACWADVSFDPAPTYQKFFPEPFFEPHVETQPSTEAYKRVLSDSGASQPVRDAHDARIVNETLTGTAAYVGSVSGKKGLIDDPKDAGGLEDFPAAKRGAAWDADGDGIADWWDGSTGGEGYTPIEGYLNFLADPHAFVSPSGSVEVDLASLALGFKEPSFTVTGAEKGEVTVSGGKATYAAGAEAGIDYFDIGVEDSEGSTWTRRFGVAIFEGAEDV
ncbi:Putative pectin lyase/virulence factor, immunoglobulin-like protein [Colletotrichum destructivum]|uniref:Pectin lyase/virulence factor, immunoglobulin-like protein n=1 Tax=Colletotrichum destructivum TaxID=34406 RepID=A0AAX4HWB7_9PEZI|nr:Putative pectin lyase/virulence factor, immunoglobulin-like protein [Colletotrichum destructivum]